MKNGVSQNQEYLFGGPYNKKEKSIWEFILGYPDFGKLPNDVEAWEL